MDNEAGFRIDGILYPFPDSYTVGDSVLIKVLSGLDMEDYFEGLAEVQEQAAALTSGQARLDPRLFAALIGVSVWRAHPRWSVERATQFVQRIDMDKLVTEQAVESIEEETPEGDASPPAPTPTELESQGKSNGAGHLSDVSLPSLVGESRPEQAERSEQTDASEGVSDSEERHPSPSGSPPSATPSPVSTPGI